VRFKELLGTPKIISTFQLDIVKMIFRKFP